MKRAQQILLTLHIATLILTVGGLVAYDYCRGERECIPDSITKIGV